MSAAWRVELFRLGVIAAVSIIGALLTGHGFVFLSLGLGAYVAAHLFYLVRLRDRLQESGKGAPLAASGLWADVFALVDRLQTRSRKRKRRLSRFINRFREATTVLPDAAVIMDRHARIEWSNPGGVQLLGLRWPSDVGKALTERFNDPTFKEYLANRDYQQPLEIPSPTDESIILGIWIMPFGKKRQQLLIGRDITSVYNLERVRRDFVANVSHELRTPLSVISGHLETISDAEASPEDLHRPVEVMREQAARMENIIGDLLLLSRLEMEGDLPPQTPVDVAQLLAATVAEAKVLSGDQGHDFSIDVDPEVGLLGSAQELRSAFSNLIFNAVQHTPMRTRIAVRWARSNGGAILEISNDGPGIAARHIPRLTERFYRVDSARSRETGGTGLGLAIVKHVLERHGSELRIVSKSGHGITFGCEFPKERCSFDSSSAG
jgi:two-component system phosphate regulon sensor histidine kinase PhoR